MGDVEGLRIDLPDTPFVAPVCIGAHGADGRFILRFKVVLLSLDEEKEFSEVHGESVFGS